MILPLRGFGVLHSLLGSELTLAPLLSLLFDLLEHVCRQHNLLHADSEHDILDIWNEKLALEIIEAMNNSEEQVVCVLETAARAWIAPSVHTIPCFAVKMNDLTGAANKSARRRRIRRDDLLRLWRDELLRLRRDELLGLRHDELL